jgi:hypothetical protein
VSLLPDTAKKDRLRCCRRRSQFSLEMYARRFGRHLQFFCGAGGAGGLAACGFAAR